MKLLSRDHEDSKRRLDTLTGNVEKLVGVVDRLAELALSRERGSAKLEDSNSG